MNTPDQLRRELADLGSMEANAGRSAEEIRKGAAERLDAVNARLAEIAGEALSGDGEEYLALVEERGQLQKVLAE